MSRIGRRPIAIPPGVEIALDGPRITVRGPKGELQRTLPAAIQVRVDDGRVVVERPSEAKPHRELHGLTRTLVANMVEGVTNGYRKTLEITIVTSARSDEEGRRLLEYLGMPITG